MTMQNIMDLSTALAVNVTGRFKGSQRSHAPQDARGDEVTLSTKDFSVQFYTKCAV